MLVGPDDLAHPTHDENTPALVQIRESFLDGE
jgi:hypothetical protein